MGLFPAIVIILTALLELWVVLTVFFITNNSLYVYLLCGIGLNFCSVLYVIILIFRFLHFKTCAKENLMRAMCIGPDYWAPIPCWEWNDEPLLWNVCDYSKENGWDELYPKPIACDIEDGRTVLEEGKSTTLSNSTLSKETERSYDSLDGKQEEIKVGVEQEQDEFQDTSKSHPIHANEGVDDENDKEAKKESRRIRRFGANTPFDQDTNIVVDLRENLKKFISRLSVNSKRDKDDTQQGPHDFRSYEVECLEPTEGEPIKCSLNEYENHYISMAKAQDEPTALVSVCYLLAKDSNDFLLESIDYFKKIHKAPVYVMMNARDGGDWIHEQLDIISSYVDQKYRDQVRVFFVKPSRSKAANLNALVDIVRNEEYHDYKYVLNYDIDDRPTFNETSAFTYAEKVVGTKRGGTRIVGIQGPCLECFNDTLSGLLEARHEFNAQTDKLAMRSRFGLKTESQGSNHLILSEVFRRYRFDTKVLLEDWRWSNDMKEDQNIGLMFVRTMVCYGQTPYGLRAVLRRRNRWVKGRWTEWIHDVFERPLFTPLFKERVTGLMVVVNFLLLQPMLHLLMLMGYILVTSEAHVGFLFLNTKLLEETENVPRKVGVWWNWTWPIGLGALLLIYFVHGIMKLVNFQSVSFLNGRDTFRYRVFYAFCILFDSLTPIVAPFTVYYQYQYYCLVEYVLEKVIQKKIVWVPTPKVAQKEEADGKYDVVKQKDSKRLPETPPVTPPETPLVESAVDLG